MTFAAWHVEKRSENQLLLSDLYGRTRSWLMVAPVETEKGAGTRLYFGSAVIPVQNSRTGKSTLGLRFRALLGFHKIYSEVLLSAAKQKLRAESTRRPARFDGLLIPLLAYAAASLFHHVHNAEFLNEYPNMPAGLSPARVYAAWLGVTAVGLSGYILIRRGYELAGLAALAVYGALGLLGLAHYTRAPLSAHTLTMNVTIGLEAGTGLLLLAAVARRIRRRRVNQILFVVSLSVQ